MNTEFCPSCDTPDAIFVQPRLSAAICYSCYTTFCTACENQLRDCDCDPPPPRILKNGRAVQHPKVSEEKAIRAFTDV